MLKEAEKSESCQRSQDPSHVLAGRFPILYSFSQRRPPSPNPGKAPGLTEPGSVAQNFAGVGKPSSQSPQGPRLLPALLWPTLVWDLDSWGGHFVILFPLKPCPQKAYSSFSLHLPGQNWDTRSPSCKRAGTVDCLAGLVASRTKKEALSAVDHGSPHLRCLAPCPFPIETCSFPEQCGRWPRGRGGLQLGPEAQTMWEPGRQKEGYPGGAKGTSEGMEVGKNGSGGTW